MPHDFFVKKIPHNGLTYSEYSKQFEENLKNTDPDKLDAEEKEHFDYAKLNIQRSSRIDRTYTPSEDLKAAVAKITAPQLWMVLTEEWCGDSAQNIPYLAKIAAQNPLIDFRILYRDKNLEIMDLYLTNGTRSIPILAAFDEAGNELFKWGPRPKEAAELVKNAKAAGDPKPVFLEKLHLWYGKNRGAALEMEILNLLKNIKQ